VTPPNAPPSPEDLAEVIRDPPPTHRASPKSKAPNRVEQKPTEPTFDTRFLAPDA
jgi:hypothetical protein